MSGAVGPFKRQREERFTVRFYPGFVEGILQPLTKGDAMNKVFLTGNLTADPKKETVGAKTLATFTIAVNEGEKVSFFDCKAWGGWGDNLKARKGTTLVVEGRLAQERWSDKTGTNHSKVVIVCDSVREVAKRTKTASEAPSEAATATA